MTRFNFYGDWGTPLPTGHSRAGQTVHNSRESGVLHFPCECGGEWVVVNKSNDYRGVSIQYTHYEAEKAPNGQE